MPHTNSNTLKRPDEKSKLPNVADLLQAARLRTWHAVEEISKSIHIGMSESQAIKIAQQTLVRMGSRKFWHKCHVRFGESTILSFNDPHTDRILNENDIFYIDIGPIWSGIEGDAGTTFVIGDLPEYRRCCDDVKKIFAEVSQHWQVTQATGRDLYIYTEKCAQERGWVLAPSYVRGHRLSEFPHSFHTKLQVGELDFHPSPDCWVLEIHICDPDMRFGAFHEDLL